MTVFDRNKHFSFAITSAINTERRAIPARRAREARRKFFDSVVID